MKSKNKNHSRISLVLVASMLVVLSACDSTNAMLEPEASGSAAIPSAITTKLDLTNQQTQHLNEVIEQRQGTPGALWYTAAELQQTLNASQKETLLAGLDDGPLGSMRKRMGRQGRTDSLRIGRRGLENRAMLSELDLTDAQKEQLKTLRTQNREQMKSLMQQRRDGTTDAEALQAQMKAARESMQASLEQILTADQLEKLEANRPKLDEDGARRFSERERVGRDQRGQQGRDRASAGVEREEITAAMAEALGLTEAQQEALKQQREASIASFKTLREKARAEGMDRDALMQAFKASRETRKEEAQAIFTAEQLEIIQIHQALAIALRNSSSEKSATQGKRRFRR